MGTCDMGIFETTVLGVILFLQDKGMRHGDLKMRIKQNMGTPYPEPRCGKMWNYSPAQHLPQPPSLSLSIGLLTLNSKSATYLLYVLPVTLLFSIAVLPHSPGVVYYHLLLRRETRIPGVAPFSFRIGIWDLLVHRGQKSYTPTAFGKLWTTPGVRCIIRASS